MAQACFCCGADARSLVPEHSLLVRHPFHPRCKNYEESPGLALRPMSIYGGPKGKWSSSVNIPTREVRRPNRGRPDDGVGKKRNRRVLVPFSAKKRTLVSGCSTKATGRYPEYPPCVQYGHVKQLGTSWAPSVRSPPETCLVLPSLPSGDVGE